jgi:uncharacterized membrane protein YjfL (UPF0719 family)
MSGDELIVTLISVGLGPVAWLVWLFRMPWGPPVRPRRCFAMVSGALGVSTLLIFIVLRTVASFDVVDDFRYQFMYLVLGLAWLRIAVAGFSLAGLSARDDVVERGNPAAAIALSGALIAMALCYSGGNIGDGPGWWVVVFSAAVSSLTCLAFWVALTLCSSIADAVTIDRDAASGLRLAAFLVGLGLVLGRGVSGDWLSATRTVVDFIKVLPAAAAILLVAIAVEYVARPTPERPQGPLVALGVLPALAYLMIAAAGARALGWPA